MNIEEYADILNLEIDLKYYPNQGGRWCADFENVEIKEGSMLISAHGNAKTIPQALEDYVLQIRGKRIVVNAYSGERQEFDVPESLEIS